MRTLLLLALAPLAAPSLAADGESAAPADRVERQLQAKASKSSKSEFSMSLPSKSSKSSEFPDYCFDSFCYVDPTACDTGATVSGYFPTLYFSYTTCSADPEGPGEDGCACIDSAVILAAEVEAGNLESCDFNGEPGAVTVSGGICLPLTYGSGECALHSLDEVFCGGGVESAKAFKASSKGSKTGSFSYTLSMPSKSSKSGSKASESIAAIEASKSSKTASPTASPTVSQSPSASLSPTTSKSGKGTSIKSAKSTASPTVSLSPSTSPSPTTAKSAKSTSATSSSEGDVEGGGEGDIDIEDEDI